MKKLSERQDEVLAKAGKWIKSHGEKYCPITAVKRISHWKKTVKELRKKDLATLRKGGEVVYVTKWGWRYLEDKHPEITRRGGSGEEIPLE